MDSRPSLSERFGFAGLSFGAAILLSVVTSVVMARVYGITVVGQWALAAAPVGALWFLSTVREQPALIRAITPLSARDPRVSGLFTAVFAFSTALTLVTSVIVMVAAYFLYKGPIGQPDLFVPALVNTAGYVVLTNWSWNFDSVFAAFGDGRQLYWIRLHQQLVFVAMLVALSFVLPTVWGPVVATIASWTTPLLHRLVTVRRWMRLGAARSDVVAGFKALPGLLKFGLKLTPGSIAVGVSGEVGTWVLGTLGSVQAVGAYNRAWTLSRRVQQFNWRIAEMLFPALVERRANGDREGFDRVLIDSIRYVFVLLLLPAAAVGGAADEIMRVFGPGFVRAGPVLALTVVNPALATLTTLQGVALMAADRPLSTTYAQVAGVVATVVSTVALTLWLGITGTAVGVLVGPSVVIVCMGMALRHDLSTPLLRLWPLRNMLAAVGAYAGGFAAARLLASAVPYPGGIVAGVAGGALAYLLVFVAAGGMTQGDWSRLRRIRRRDLAPVEV